MFFIIWCKRIKSILLDNDFIVRSVSSSVPCHLLKVGLVLCIALPDEFCIQHLVRRFKEICCSSLSCVCWLRDVGCLNLDCCFYELLLLRNWEKFRSWAWNRLILCHWNRTTMLLRYILRSFNGVVCLFENVLHLEHTLLLLEIVELWNSSRDWIRFAEIRSNYAWLICFMPLFITIRAHRRR